MKRKPILYLHNHCLKSIRANMIQALHTLEGLNQVGLKPKIYLRYCRDKKSIAERLKEFGIQNDLDISYSRLLGLRLIKHRTFGLFIWRYRKQLLESEVYIRTPKLSMALAGANIPHHLEIHEIHALQDKVDLEKLIQFHQQGIIRYLIPISQAAYYKLAELGAVEERMHIAPSGVDISAFRKLDDFKKERLEQPEIIYIGRISGSRGLKILEAIADSNIAKVSAIGPQEDTLNTDNITIHPRVPHQEVAEWYGKSSLQLLPYQTNLEHADAISPMKLFEALAARRPIIASDLPPIREILTHEKTALLVPADQPEAWINAIKTLQKHPDLAAKLVTNGYQLVQQYSWEARARGIALALNWID